MSRVSPNNREAARSRARRAGFWIRAAAAGIDAGTGFTASLVLASGLGTFFAHRAVVTLRIGEPDTFWRGPLPMVLGAIGEVVYLLPFILLITWTLEPITGATIGKRLLGLRVRAVDGETASRRTRWVRSVVQTVGLWGWTLALLTGRWEIALLASLSGGVVLAGSLAALGPASLALHDRLCGTSVCRVERKEPLVAETP